MHAFHPVLLILYDGDGDGVSDSNGHGTSQWWKTETSRLAMSTSELPDLELPIGQSFQFSIGPKLSVENATPHEVCTLKQGLELASGVLSPKNRISMAAHLYKAILPATQVTIPLIACDKL